MAGHEITRMFIYTWDGKLPLPSDCPEELPDSQSPSLYTLADLLKYRYWQPRGARPQKLILHQIFCPLISPSVKLPCAKPSGRARVD